MSQSHQIIIVTGWLLSIAALVVTIAVVIRIVKKREKTESTVPVWIVYAIGIFVTAFILVLSQNIVDLGGTPDAPNILDSLLSSLQMFVLGRGIDLNIEMLEWMGPLLLVYAVYNAALFLAVPAATAGTVISLIGQMLSVPRMLSLARKRGSVRRDVRPALVYYRYDPHGDLSLFYDKAVRPLDSGELCSDRVRQSHHVPDACRHAFDALFAKGQAVYHDRAVLFARGFDILRVRCKYGVRGLYERVRHGKQRPVLGLRACPGKCRSRRLCLPDYINRCFHTALLQGSNGCN